MPTYKLTKLCNKLLKPITNNEYNIKGSFSYVKEVEEFDSNLVKLARVVNIKLFFMD